MQRCRGRASTASKRDTCSWQAGARTPGPPNFALQTMLPAGPYGQPRQETLCAPTAAAQAPSCGMGNAASIRLQPGAWQPGASLFESLVAVTAPVRSLPSLRRRGMAVTAADAARPAGRETAARPASASAGDPAAWFAAYTLQRGCGNGDRIRRR